MMPINSKKYSSRNNLLKSINSLKDYYNKAIWVCCSDNHFNWIVDEGVNKLIQKPHILDVNLSKGGGAFLLSFLKIVNPNLPFDRIVDVDLEFLIEELSVLIDCPREWRTEKIIKKEQERENWFQKGVQNLTIILILVKDSELNDREVINTLAALRLASFCTVEIEQLVVIDKYDLLETFDNSSINPSGRKDFIFQIFELRDEKSSA
jgi:hypothetical protein